VAVPTWRLPGGDRRVWAGDRVGRST